MKARAIELQIDELVLHGFAPQERRAIADALQHELTALLQQRGLRDTAVRHHEADTIRAPQVNLPAEAQPAQTGRAVARSIYGTLQA